MTRSLDSKPIAFGTEIQEGSPPSPTKSRSARRDVPRLTYRSPEVAAMLGISERLLQVERSAGRFPKPDLMIGRLPLWRLETVDRWIEEGGRR